MQCRHIWLIADLRDIITSRLLQATFAGAVLHAPPVAFHRNAGIEDGGYSVASLQISKVGDRGLVPYPGCSWRPPSWSVHPNSSENDNPETLARGLSWVR